MLLQLLQIYYNMLLYTCYYNYYKCYYKFAYASNFLKRVCIQDVAYFGVCYLDVAKGDSIGKTSLICAGQDSS